MCRQILLKYSFEETVVFAVYVYTFPDTLSKSCVCVCIHLPTPELNMLETGLNPLGGTRRVGGLLGVAGRPSGTVSPFRAPGSALCPGLDAQTQHAGEMS